MASLLHRASVISTRTIAAVSLTLCTALPLAACSAPNEDDGKAAGESPASSSVEPSPTVSADPDRAAKEAVLTAYDAFWREQVKAFAQADIKGTDLKKYATKKALGSAMGDVLVMKKAGTATTGSPTHDTKVTSLTVSGSIPKATVQDCLDISNWKTVKRPSGEVQPFPTNQPLRYIATATAEKWGTQWMITELTPEGTRTC